MNAAGTKTDRGGRLGMGELDWRALDLTVESGEFIQSVKHLHQNANQCNADEEYETYFWQ